MKYTEAFRRTGLDTDVYRESKSILDYNNMKPTHIVGGYVFKHIIQDFYGTTPSYKDIDYIITTNHQDIILPEGWKKECTRFGSPRLKGPYYTIDIIPLDEVKDVLSKQLRPSIEYFMATTPLTIQSIAYDINNDQVIGQLGKDAIDRKVIEVNSLKHAFIGLWFRKKRLRWYMTQKAKQTSFTIIPFD